MQNPVSYHYTLLGLAIIKPTSVFLDVRSLRKIIRLMHTRRIHAKTRKWPEDRRKLSVLWRLFSDSFLKIC